jgi:hypothetical protein
MNSGARHTLALLNYQYAVELMRIDTGRMA